MTEEELLTEQIRTIVKRRFIDIKFDIFKLTLSQYDDNTTEIIFDLYGEKIAQSYLPLALASLKKSKEE